MTTEMEQGSEYWKNKGNECYKSKDYIKAVELYGKSIELDSINPGLLTNRAAAYLMLLMYKEAIQDCDGAISLDSNNAKAYFRKATAAKGLGRLDSAIDALSKGLEIEPKTPTAIKDKEILTTAKDNIPIYQKLILEKKFRIALQQIDTTIGNLGNNFRDFNLMKVECLIGLKRPQDALNLSNMMMKTAQNGDVELLRMRGNCYYEMGDVENAFKHLQMAIRSDPDNIVIRTFYKKIKDIEEKKNRGDDLFKSGNNVGALQSWSECIELCRDNRPYSAKLYLNRATAYSKINQNENAVKDCNVAIVFNPDYLKAYIRRADCLLLLGGGERIEQAISDYEKAFELESNETNLRTIQQKVKKAKIALKRSKQKDLYAVLGVSSEATETEIKSAYRKAALKYHPDRHASKSDAEKSEAETIFKNIGEAYEILSTPEKKAKYDQGMDIEEIESGEAQGGGGHGGHGGMDPNMLFHMFMQQQQQGGNKYTSTFGGFENKDKFQPSKQIDSNNIAQHIQQLSSSQVSTGLIPGQSVVGNHSNGINSSSSESVNVVNNNNFSSTATSATLLKSQPPIKHQGKNINDGEYKYWKYPGELNDAENEDLVIIHVCDDNQHISKDFCCKRDILVRNMKYFEKFLSENENGYDDIDISVHCDVEIFEWLMSFIHEPNNPPQIDKSIIVSILISSEFLQMDNLVELCIQNVATNLNDIIKLPIDLSCISEKLINRIAAITTPKMLSETKDRKDKIITKLYKRRVELDFSRKGSVLKNLQNSHVNANHSQRTIAAYLTCCKYCGMVYLDNYVNYLNCRNSMPTIDFHGQLARRHSAVINWSLTNYLKTLHSGGMPWDGIYWHVWAACIVFRINKSIVISALEHDRYIVEPDGLMIKASILKTSDPQDSMSSTIQPPRLTSTLSILSSPSTSIKSFSLSQEDNFHFNDKDIKTYKLFISKHCEYNREMSFNHLSKSLKSNTSSNTNLIPTSTLNPNRPPEVLTEEIYGSINSQFKYIVGEAYRQLINNTMKAMIEAPIPAVLPNIDSSEPANGSNPTIKWFDFYDIIWKVPSESVSNVDVTQGTDDKDRRRGRSPAVGVHSMRINASSVETRKFSSSTSKVRATTTNTSNIRSSSPFKDSRDKEPNPDPNGAGGRGTMVENPSIVAYDSSDNDVNSDNDAVSGGAGGGPRRSRSTSYTGLRQRVHRSSSQSKVLGNRNTTAKKAFVGFKKASFVSNSNGFSLDFSSIADPVTKNQLIIMKSFPPEVLQRVLMSKGPSYGMWMIAHPLQMLSAANIEALQMIVESSLPDHKKLEWELDILREHDEKRMERFGKFLASRRNNLLDSTVGPLIKPAGKNNAKSGNLLKISNVNRANQHSKGGNDGGSNIVNDPHYLPWRSQQNGMVTGDHYYRDKGRQPLKL